MITVPLSQGISVVVEMPDPVERVASAKDFAFQLPWS